MTEQDYTAAAAEEWDRILPTDGPSPLEVTMRLRRAAMHLDGVIAGVIAPTRLANYGEYEVLASLRRAGRSLTPRELADRLLITKAGMTGRLDRLDQAGLTERTPNPNDARSTKISLTATGTTLVDEVYLTLMSAQQVALSGLTADEQSQLAHLLQRFLLTFDDIPRDESNADRTT